jgi:hypothetical protein
MPVKRLLMVAIAALGLSLSGYAASAGSVARAGIASSNQSPAVNSKSTFTLIRGGGHGGGHGGGYGGGWAGHSSMPAVGPRSWSGYSGKPGMAMRSWSGHSIRSAKGMRSFRREREFRHHRFRHRRFFRGGRWWYDGYNCDSPSLYPYCYDD